MTVHVVVQDSGVNDVIQKLRAIPSESERAMRQASVKTGNYLRSEARKRVSAATSSRVAKTRVRGSKRYIWLGGNSVPSSYLRGIVRRQKKRGGFTVNGVHYRNSFLDKRGRLWNRFGQKNYEIELLLLPIANEIYQIGDDLQALGGPKLADEFMKAAQKNIVNSRVDRDPSTFKGKTTDSLAGIKYIRTNIR